MKLKVSELKQLLESHKENTLVDNIFNYYFEGKFVPSVITEDKIVFYVPGNAQFFLSEYVWDKDGISLNGIKKLSFENEVSEEEKEDTLFKTHAEGVFEIDEDRKSFSKSLKNIKKAIKTNEAIINEDVWLDRIKEMGLVKVKTYLMKPTGGTTNNWSGNDKNAFKTQIDSATKSLWADLKSGITKNISGRAINSFYDMYDVNKMKFNHTDGKGLYKDLKVTLPKNHLWLAENSTLLDKAIPEWKVDATIDYSIVGDTSSLLKKKKYVAEGEQCPCEERVSDLLISYKNRDKVEKFWKWGAFKAGVKKMNEDEVEVVDFIKKFEPLAWLNEKKLIIIFEHALVDIYSDASQLGRAKEVAEIVAFASKDEARQTIVEDILGTEIENVNDLVEDLEGMNEEIRDYKSPEDDEMKFVSGLMATISDIHSKYRATNMDESNGKALYVINDKLNDIWARQRITNDDRKFLKTVVENIENFEAKDRDASAEEVAVKDEQRDGFSKFETDVLQKNTIEVASSSEDK